MRYFAVFILLLQALIGFSQGKSIGNIEADFQGGKAEFKQLLLHEMIYPPKALEQGLKAKVGYEIFVKKNGEKIITRPLFTDDEAFNEEAKRLINLTEFVPGAVDGDPYDSKKMVVIKFNPKKYNKMVEQRGYAIPLKPANASPKIEVFSSDKVDQAPTPLLPKGTSIDDFIYKQITYPPHAVKMNMIGKTILEFVVEPSGNITNVHPLHYLGGGCYEEARRVLGLIKWNPAIKNGKVVRCRMKHTVYFNLPNSQKRSPLETIAE